MDISHAFTVDRAPEEVWPVLTDLRAVAQAIPGASIEDVESDGTHHGKLRVRLGSISASFRGQARYVSVDLEGRTFVLEGAGRSPQGGATLRVEGRLTGETTSAVELTSVVKLTGQLGQFAGGMADDVVRNLLDVFVANLKSGFDGSADEGLTRSTTSPSAGTSTPASAPWHGASADELNLGAGLLSAVPGRLVAAAGAVGLMLVGILIGRRGRRGAVVAGRVYVITPETARRLTNL